MANDALVGDLTQFAAAANGTISHLRPLPVNKKIRVQFPTRDLSQLFDNRIPLDHPALLAADATIAAFNEAAGPNGIYINGRESNSGAAPEVYAYTGQWTLQAVARQAAVLPATIPDGTPFHLAFLARSNCGFTRSQRNKEEIKDQFRLIAQEASRNGATAKISIFDTPHRPEFVKASYEAVYELVRDEGLKIVLEGSVGVSDDPNLTEEAFRQRIRGFLKMDQTVRKEMGMAKSAMKSFALKNTDGRLRGDNVSFAEGNTGIYTRIQLQEMDRNLKVHGTGPREARNHTHDIAFANASGEAALHSYLTTKTESKISFVLDALPGGKYFVDMFAVFRGLRDKRGWDVGFTTGQRSAAKRAEHMLDMATKPFRQNAVFTPTPEEWLRFHCAPAALSSGIRLGALPHARKLILAQGDEAVKAAPDDIIATTIRVWGLSNAAVQRLLGELYSITPIANYHNMCSGDLTQHFAESGFISDLIAKSVNPRSILDANGDQMALANLDKIVQVPAAAYLTHVSINVPFQPGVFQRLCEIRTSAVLNPDQAKSFFAKDKIADYAQLRIELLANVTDKDAAEKILKTHGVGKARRKTFIGRYIGHDMTPAGEGLPDLFDKVIPQAEAEAKAVAVMQAKAAAADGKINEARVIADPALARELRFAANVGAIGGVYPEKYLKSLAHTPSHIHPNMVVWWEGVQQKNNSEATLWGMFKASGAKTFEQFLDKDPVGALVAGKYFFNHFGDFRHDFGIREALFFNPRVETRTEELRALYIRDVLVPDLFTVTPRTNGASWFGNGNGTHARNEEPNGDGRADVSGRTTWLNSERPKVTGRGSALIDAVAK